MNRLELIETEAACLAFSTRCSHFVWPADRRRLVLLVPHADGEIFDCTGLLQEWAALVSETLIIYVNASEGVLSCADADEKAALARLQRQESRRTIEALDLPGNVRICEFNIVDSEVKSLASQLEERLRFELDASCIVIAPHDRGGHSDHEAISICARQLATTIGFDIYFYPIQLWLSKQPDRSEDREHRNASPYKTLMVH